MRAALSAILLALSFAVSTAHAQASRVPSGPRFDIARYAVDGVTLIPAASIDRALKPFTGNQRDFGTIQQALRAIEKAYADAGYAASVRALLDLADRVDAETGQELSRND